MAEGKIQRLYEMASMQIASEAFLIGATSSNLAGVLNEGNLALSVLPESETTKFGIDDSSKRYQIVAHQDLSLRAHEPLGNELGVLSGFSATLYYDTKAGEYTLSFRSTEFNENIRDVGDIEADVEIGLFGWAFSQIHSMQAFWDFLTLDAPLPTEGLKIFDNALRDQFRSEFAAGGSVNVTGYSLGANLATAFTELHEDRVNRTYLFNGAGTGQVLPSSGLNLASIWASYDAVFDSPGSDAPYIETFVPNHLALLAANNLGYLVEPTQFLGGNSLARNPRHYRALDAIETRKDLRPRKQLLAGEVFEGQLRFPLIVRLPEDIRASKEAIGEVELRTPSGQRIPLARLADIELTEGPSTITREWGYRRINISSNIRGRDMGSFVAEAQRRIEEEVQLPPGRYHLEWGGQFENLISARRRLMIVVPIALTLIFLLLYMTYNNVVDAIRVFTGVPFAWTGGIIALWLRDMPFSISAAIGFVVLSGVAVLDDMLLVSYIRQLRARGMDLESAVENAAMTRLRPVLMTALVAALGFVPMAFNTGMGAEVQRPLATVVIGGVISAMVMSLLVLRVLYMVFAGGVERRESRVESGESRGESREPMIESREAAVVGAESE